MEHIKYSTSKSNAVHFGDSGRWQKKSWSIKNSLYSIKIVLLRALNMECRVSGIIS